MKKVYKFMLSLCVCICLAFPLSLLSACSDRDNEPDIVVTIFPQYDWVMQILGDNTSGVNVKYLLSTGVDLHNYAPSVKDISAIKNCKIFIYVGGDSDGWVKDVLSQNPNENRIAISLTEVLGIEAHEHEEDGEEHDDHEHDVSNDEHVWLSPVNAQVLVEKISEAVCQIDDNNSGKYQLNTKQYISQLKALDAAFAEASKQFGSRHDLRFAIADRNPFTHMFDQYHIHGDQVKAAFDGCAATLDVNAQTIDGLINFVNEHQLTVILTIEKPNREIRNLADAVKNGSQAKNQQILALHSGQNVTKSEIDDGFTYLDMMSHNLSVFIQAASYAIS